MMMKNYNIFTCVHIVILHGSPMRINIYLKIIEINKYYIYNTNESSGKKF